MDPVLFFFTGQAICREKNEDAMVGWALPTACKGKPQDTRFTWETADRRNTMVHRSVCLRLVQCSEPPLPRALRVLQWYSIK